MLEELLFIRLILFYGAECKPWLFKTTGKIVSAIRANRDVFAGKRAPSSDRFAAKRNSARDVALRQRHRFMAVSARASKRAAIFGSLAGGEVVLAVARVG